MQAIVLAGGASSRFWPLNTRHKSLLKIRGRTLLGHTLDGLVETGITDIVVVQGPARAVERELDAPGEADVSFAVQEEPDGMGDALAQARGQIDGRFVVTGPYRIDTAELVDALRDAAMDGGAVVATETDEPERYGVLAVEDDRAAGIVEKPAPDEAPSDLRAVSTYLLHEEFFDELDAVDDHEYSFEDALASYMDRVDVGVARLDAAPPSLKYPWDAFGFAERLLDRQEPRIADGAEVADSATIEGNVVVEDGARVYENAVVRGPAYIGADATVGNHALVRSYTDIEEGGTVGANAEVRGSILQEGFSMHSGFVGDTIAGPDVAVGAGAVTANRRVRGEDGRGTVQVHVRARDETVDTGRTRLGAVIGAGADIGTQANLMPGVCIGPRSFVGPSTMVRHNVGADKTYYAKVEGVETERR